MQLGHPLPLSIPFSSFDLASRPIVAVAISGGSDSTATLLLLREHLRLSRASTQILALTVDHRLRANSRREAEDTARLCARFDIPHRILSWDGQKPSTGVPAAAREARYDLLAAAAGEAGADIVITGHTLDDQLETVAMRRARGAGIGLSGMAPVTLFDGGIWIARPMLRVRRETLRDFLRRREIGWAEDPTNIDMRFERPRIRATAAEVGPADGELAAIEAAGLRREVLSIGAAALIENHVRSPLPGLLHLSRDFLNDGEADARVHALRILLAVTGGSPHLPDADRVVALLDRLRQPPHRATLSRALVASRRDGVWMCRETRGLPQAVPVRDGLVWDGRFRMRLASPGRPLEVTPLGSVGAAAQERDASLPPALAQTAAAAMPLVRAGEPAYGRGSSPVENVSIVPVMAPWLRYLPGFDIPAARSVSRLIGAPEIPSSPWRGHIVTRA